jgi:hypothetical protein
MCIPAAALTFGSLALGAIGQVANYSAAQSAAAQQEAYNQTATEAANRQFIDQSTQEAIRQGQEQEATAQRVFATNTQLAQRLATARVAAGEAGVSGLSVDALMGDLYRQAGRVNQATERNLQFTQQANTARQKGYLAQRDNTINGLPVAKRPGFGQLALGIAGAAGDSLMSVAHADPQNPGRVSIPGITDW